MNKAANNRGFTLIEIMVAVAILGVLSAIAVIFYRHYIDRARAAEIVEKWDVVRTQVNVSLAQGANQCADIAKRFGSNNLDGPPYARLSIDLVAAQGGATAGWRPVMVVCARADRHGPKGVGAAREAHNIFSKNTKIESGAVLTESVVSFAVPLSQGTGSTCAVPFGNKLDACGDPVAVPTATAIKTPGSAQSPAVPTPQQVQVPRCTVTAGQQIDRQVMTFGSALTGYIMNNGDLDTGGDMRALSAEVAIVGGQQVASSAGHGATILSYAFNAPGRDNEFIIWEPGAIKITVRGRDFVTGYNANDGRNHRLTVTWESTSGALILYDNGKEVWRGTANQGGTIGGNGKLVLGQDQDHYGGGFGTNDAFQGKIVTASLANVVVSGAAIGSGPLQTALNAQNGLVTNVILGPDGKPVDTTGKRTYVSGGALTSTTQKVDTGLYVTKDCS